MATTTALVTAPEFFAMPECILPGSTGCIQGAPEIAIEIVSSEAASRLEEKTRLYLAHGSKSVWAVFPKDRIVRIDDSEGGTKKFRNGQTLTDPALPGFSIITSALFEGL